MEPDDLLCSLNARPVKALVGRAQWKINQEVPSKLGGSITEACAFREQEDDQAALPPPISIHRCSSLPQTLPSFRRIPPALFPNTRLFESVCTDAEGLDG